MTNFFVTKSTFSCSDMLLLDKVKNLELELFVAREQTNRSSNSVLNHMLSV